MAARFGRETWSLVVPEGWRAWHDDECATLVGPGEIGALQISVACKGSEVVDTDLREFAAEHLRAGVKPRPTEAGDFVGFEIAFSDEERLWRQWYLRRARQDSRTSRPAPATRRYIAGVLSRVRWLVVLALLANSGCRSLREASEVAANSLAGGMEIGWRVGGRMDPDLTMPPDAPGYIDALETEGPQLHYHSERLNATVIAGDVRVGDEVVRAILATYAGTPSADVALERLCMHPSPAILVVEVVDRAGRPREDVAVRVESATGDYEVSTTSNDGGRFRFELWSDTWYVRRENTFLWFPGKRHEVRLGAREKVQVSLGAEGLVLASRAKPE